jgi:dihydroorotate dehydrogenase (fumarate)
MADLSTSYMGLKLKNPVVVASSRLTYDVDKVAECEDAGAGAVVLKSIFEEQIEYDSRQMIGGMDFDAYTEAYDYFKETSRDYYIDNYLSLVEEAKKRVDIPVIASINAVGSGSWIEYATRFQQVGADALELNLYIVPANVAAEGREIERGYFDVLRKVRKKTNLPIALKLGSQFSGMARTMKEFADEGADGLVLFNRFYKPDIDIEKLSVKTAQIYSAPEEMAFTLQWIALLAGKVPADLAANTGIHTARDVIKQLLAGAKVTEVCSQLMRKGVGEIASLTQGLEEWMDRKGFSSVEEFRGKMSQENLDHPEVYERSQYIKALVGIE